MNPLDNVIMNKVPHTQKGMHRYVFTCKWIIVKKYQTPMIYVMQSTHSKKFKKREGTSEKRFYISRPQLSNLESHTDLGTVYQAELQTFNSEKHYLPQVKGNFPPQRKAVLQGSGKGVRRLLVHQSASGKQHVNELSEHESDTYGLNFPWNTPGVQVLRGGVEEGWRILGKSAATECMKILLNCRPARLQILLTWINAGSSWPLLSLDEMRSDTGVTAKDFPPLIWTSFHGTKDRKVW